MFELDKTHFENAQKRIKDRQSRQTFFDIFDIAPEPQQANLFDAKED